MKVVADISDALLKASEAVEVPTDTTTDKINALNEKCYYYKSLIVNHARGDGANESRKSGSTSKSAREIP